MNDVPVAERRVLPAKQAGIVLVDEEREMRTQSAVFVTETLGVSLPSGPRFGMQRVLAVLLGAEVSVTYLYGLILAHGGRPVLALKTDDLEMAATFEKDFRSAYIEVFFFVVIFGPSLIRFLLSFGAGLNFHCGSVSLRLNLNIVFASPVSSTVT